MAVTFHNSTQTAGAASVASRTVSHTLSAAGASVLVFTYAPTATSLSAVQTTLGGNPIQFTRLGAISASSGRAEVWGLSAYQTSGTLAISIQPVAASLMFATVVVSYTGQRTVGGSPFGTVVAGTAQGVANVAFSLSSTTSDIVSFGFGVSGAPAVTLTTGTTRNSATASTRARLVVGDITGALQLSISATAATSNTWAFLGVPIVASATAPTTTIQFDNAAGTFTTGAVASLGFLLTATSGAVLLVWANSDQNTNFSAINVNTNQLTFVTAVSAAAPLRTELWVLTAPPSGILTISAVLAGGASNPIGIAGATYVGHRTTDTPFGGAAVTSGAAVTNQISVSSTAGNIVVMGGGARAFNPVSWSAIDAMTQRFTGTAYPAVIIADTFGGPAITAGARLFTATANNLIAINLIQSGAAAFVSGVAAFTDSQDTFSATGYVIVSGRVSATDALDALSASGKVIIQGRLSATDLVGTLSATGYVLVRGSLSATDVRDTLSATGYTLIRGRLSSTDVTDTLSASGYVIVSGRLSATDAPDLFSASGTVINFGFTSGTVAFSDAPDTLSASGYVLVSGQLSATDAPDTFSASGTVVAVSVSAAPVVVVDNSAGHGRPQKEYFRADEAFWTAREKYLKSIHKAISAEPEVQIDVPVTAGIVNTVEGSGASYIVDSGPLEALRAARSKVISAMPAASSMRQLRPLGKRLYEINARIAEQKRQQLIADRKAEADRKRLERSKARQRTIRKAKRKVVMLALTRVVGALSYLHTQI